MIQGSSLFYSDSLCSSPLLVFMQAQRPLGSYQLLGALSNYSYLSCSRSFATSLTCLTLKSNTRVQASHAASTALPGGMTKRVTVTSPHFAPGILQRTCMSRCNATLLTPMLLSKASARQHQLVQVRLRLIQNHLCSLLCSSSNGCGSCPQLQCGRK